MIQSKIFGKKVENWWNDVSDCPVSLTVKHVIFGIYYDLNHFSAINYIILLGKMYIYRQRLNEKGVSFEFFLNELRFKLEVEKTIYESNSTLTKFNQKWGNILHKL